jgi:hypothetical protein
MDDNTETIAEDLLEGADLIAEFLYGDRNKRRKVYHLASEAKGKSRLPVFRMGNILHARKSTLISWIKAQEAGATEGA